MLVYFLLLPEDRFLDEQDVAAGFLNLFDQVEDVSSLLAEHTVHLCIIRHHDLVVHLNPEKQEDGQGLKPNYFNIKFKKQGLLVALGVKISLPPSLRLYGVMRHIDM